MAWGFKKSVGYRGYAKLTPKNGTAATFLATGGSLNINQDPLTSQGIWGATPAAAAQVVAWAYNYLRVEGSISYDLTKGNVYKAIKNFAFSNRDKGASIVLKPDGGNGFTGEGYCSGATFSCSEGQIVTGDINFIGDAGASDGGIVANGDDNAGKDGSQYNNIFGSAGSGKVAGEGAVIAYWATYINGIENVTSWNASYSSDVQLLCCCTNSHKSLNSKFTGGGDKPPLGADYAILGDMTGDGSYTIFTLKGDFAPSGIQSVKKNFNITVGSAGTIKIPYAIISSASTAIQTGTSYITADFNFTAVGDGTNGPLSLV